MLRSTGTSAISTLLFLLHVSQLVDPVQSQTTTSNGCLRLSGSTACPGFSTAWVHPQNLSNAFPFFAEVDSVASFDAGVFRYLSDPDQYRQTKFVNQLGCTNSSLTVLRYSRTMLCSSWVNSRWSVECFDLYGEYTDRHESSSADTMAHPTCRFDDRRHQRRNRTQDDLPRFMLRHVR